MKKHLLFAVASLLFIGMHAGLAAKEIEVKSPNGKISLIVNVDKNISYSLYSDGVTLLQPSVISMTVNAGEVLGENPKLTKTTRKLIAETITPPFYKKKTIKDEYNQVVLKFKGDYSVEFRVFDDGAAYRFITSKKGDMIVKSERSEYNFAKDYTCWVQYVNRWGEGDKYYTTFENSYVNIPLSKVANPDSLIVSPMVVDLGSKKVAILEADLEDYAGMFLRKGDNKFSLVGDYANLPSRTSISGDKFVSADNLEAVVREGDRHEFIAKTIGARSFPWRAVVVADNDAQLMDNDMVYKLASPSRVEDMSWIKPGKVAWDWWIECDLWDVDFRSGVNYNTYKEYINFAADNKIEYIIIDVGFSKINDIMEVNPSLNIEELVKYADSKGVGVIAWGGWLSIKDQMEAACEKYSKMGIKGFKIDYMNRDDQDVVNFYYKMAETAAKYKLTLDFHGAYKPTGLHRTYPNVLTFEGVKGQEWCRWTDPEQPKHAVTAPYIRMLAGPMDFTPGVFRSESKNVFKPSWYGSMGQGTRAHQMAMYTVFESPLQMLSDSPSRYREEQECTDFIAQVPSVWDETRALDGKIGEYIIMARRTGDTWFLGALTNWDTRNLTIDFSFLPAGEYKIEYFQDGANANKTAKDYKKVVSTVKKGDKIEAKLASGGGWTAKITRK